jgi:hypothetical protein
MTFACEWGLSLHLPPPERDSAKAQYVLDFGYAPEIVGLKGPGSIFVNKQRI